MQNSPIFNFYFIKYIQILTFNPLKKQILDIFSCFWAIYSCPLEEIGFFRGLKVKISK